MSAPVEPPSPLSRSTEQTLLGIVLVLFGALTVIALAADGIAGIVDAITFNWLSVQIFVDLVIAVVVIMFWVHRDARERGRNPWPWIIAAPLVGMFSPLIYLLVRSRDREEAGGDRSMIAAIWSSLIGRNPVASTPTLIIRPRCARRSWT